MDSGGSNPPASDQSQKELSISLAASSMINASDMISADTYQANLRRIQEVREMVRRLESNNEVAHKNFLVDQLEKRAKDGREAENMLAQLRNQPGLPAAVQFTQSVPSDRSEVILPTTATLVEVPDSHSSHPSSSLAPSVTSEPPRSVPLPAKHQWSVPQVQPYYPYTFRHYMPPSNFRGATPHAQASINTGQTGWSTTQNQPLRPWIHDPVPASPQSIQAQQPLRSWRNYTPQASTLPATNDTSGHYTTLKGWNKATPAHVASSSSSSSQTYYGSTQPPTFRHPVPGYNQSSSFTSQVPASSHGVPAAAMKSLAQPSTGPHSKPTESQSRFAISQPVSISELQRSRTMQGQSQRNQQQQSQTQLQQQQSQTEGFSQLPQPQHQFWQSQIQPLSQQSQPIELDHQLPRPSVDQPSSIAPQRHVQSPQEQVPQRNQKPQIDEAMFVKLFQNVVQRGMLQLEAFWSRARAAGIPEEWLKKAINSLPRDVWETVMAQNNNRPILDATPPVNAAQRQVETIPNPDALVVSAPPLLNATPLAQTSTQQATQPNITEGDIAHFASRQSYEPYTAQLQYYAEQATKSALSVQMIDNPASSGSIAPTQITVAIPKRGVPQVKPDVRTPKDANKSTLASDILYALGILSQNPHQETEGEEASEGEGVKLTKVGPSQAISPGSTQLPAASLEPSSLDANPSSIPSASSSAQDVLQPIACPYQSIVRPVLKEELQQPAVVEGPIMIDLTLEDSDESINGKEQAFLVQPSASATISRHHSPNVNTTNHTENLSSEEPTVGVAGHNDNADVPMCSPGLAKENMGSELLYPPPSGAEQELQSFESSLSETNEDGLDGQLPLFLPSPSISPAPTEPPATDIETIADENESRPSLKRRSVDVDKMEVDTETLTPHIRKRQKQRVYVLVPPAPLYVKREKMKGHTMGRGKDSDVEEEWKDEELQYSRLEQLLIEESKLRLLERRCQWLNCGAILNCAVNLLTHLRNHAREDASGGPFFCQWVKCQREFSVEQERDVHLGIHTIRPLPCPFAGCDRQFDRPVEVMQHEVQHQKTDHDPLIHKRTCQPVVPAIPARLGLPPHQLPSHRVIPRRIAKCQISAERHATVGPWVLWNIFSPVDLNMRKQNASMRGRPTRQAIDYDMDNSDPRRDDYDFLLALSPRSAKEVQLDDLDSGVITMSAARGLTLWGSAIAATGEEYTTACDGREDGHEVAIEEDAVEKMVEIG